MPFIGQNMSPIGGNSRAGEFTALNAPMGWAYQSSTDGLADLQGIGYFDPFNKQLVAGHFIYAHLTDGNFIFTVLSVDRFLTQVTLDLLFFSQGAVTAFDVDRILTDVAGAVVVDNDGNVLIDGSE